MVAGSRPRTPGSGRRVRPSGASSAQRAALMRRIRQRGTSAELAVAAVLRALGHSYRLNVKKLPGSPDFANRKRGWALFVHGCFWHHHAGCRRATIPKTNRAFWRKKFADNRRRDAKALQALRTAGLTALVLWGCEALEPTLLPERVSDMLEPRRVDVRQPVDH